jgi:hypothetical protein
MPNKQNHSFLVINKKNVACVTDVLSLLWLKIQRDGYRKKISSFISENQEVT